MSSTYRINPRHIGAQDQATLQIIWCEGAVPPLHGGPVRHCVGHFARWYAQRAGMVEGAHLPSVHGATGPSKTEMADHVVQRRKQEPTSAPHGSPGRDGHVEDPKGRLLV